MILELIWIKSAENLIENSVFLFHKLRSNKLSEYSIFSMVLTS